MPKSPSRTSKKKKYNSRFPPARIKKIMQTDEEVGKVAAAVPVIISRALELFIESLIIETSKTTITKNAKTLSTSHIKHTIESNRQFDFLRDLVVNVPDQQAEDNGELVAQDGDSTSKKARGRQRKAKESKEGRKSKGESSKASSNTSDEEDDEDEEDDTETDDEGSVIDTAVASTASSIASGSKSVLNCPQNFQSCTPQGLSSKPAINAQQEQQYPSSNFQAYPTHPLFVPGTPQRMPNYTSPPQFLNAYQSSYPQLMPSPLLHELHHPGPQHHHLSDLQQYHSQPQPITQPQPMNLSHPWATATTTNGNEDYDT